MIELRDFLVPVGLGGLFFHLLICDRFDVKPSYSGIYPSIGWLIASLIDRYRISIPQAAAVAILLAAAVGAVCYVFGRNDRGPGKTNEPKR
jgi:hypothetical protein